jgi:hypothetical protein
LINSPMLVSADIDYHPVDVWRGGCGNHPADHVVHVNKITRLAPITVDDQRAPALRLLQIVWDHGRMGGRQMLPGPIGIEDPEADGFDAP